MALKKKPLTRLIKPLPKGQITIPIDFRRRLGIGEHTILRGTLKDGKIEISPIQPIEQRKQLREYSASQIRQFLKDDRIDSRTAAKVRRLLGKRSA